MIEVVVHRASTARSVGSWATNRIPSRMSASRCVSSSRSARSGRRTSRIAKADTRNVSASIAIVAPGPIVAASKPGDRRPDDPADVEHRLEDRARPGDLRPPDEPRDGRRVRREPQDAQHLHREGHEEDDRDRRAADPDRDRDGGGQERAAQVRGEHHPAPVPAVRVRAREQAHEEVRQRRQDVDDAHHEPRAREAEHEQRHRGAGDRIAEARDALAEENREEVAVLAKRLIDLDGGVRHGRGQHLAGRVEIDGRLAEDGHRGRVRGLPHPCHRADPIPPRGMRVACYSWDTTTTRTETTIRR